MAKSQTLHMRIDENLKMNADRLFSEIGISTTDAVNIFLKQAIIYGGFPFEVRIPKFNAVTEEAMKEAKVMAESGERRFSSAAQMRASLED